MPVRYPLTPLPDADEPWPAAPAGSEGGRRWGFWAVTSTAFAIVVAGACFAAVTVAGNGAAFSAGALSGYFSPSSFEAVRLATGDLYFAHISSHNGMVILRDAYYVDASSGQLVQGEPGRNAAWSGSHPAGGSGSFGPGRPMVVDPGQIVTAEPVSPVSPVGRQIAAIEERQARLRAATSTTTTAPLGFQ